MTAALAIEAAAALSQGARSRQEDALASAFHDGGDLGFAVLSDGMGGHAAGDVASRVIVAEVFAELTLATARADLRADDLPALLRAAVGQANDCLAAHLAAEPGRRGMGGTVVAAAVRDDRLFWASVGDSPLFLCRDGRLTRLNDDHSMAPQIDLLVARGEMDAETGRRHPQRSCLTSALTGEDIAQIDCPETGLALHPGDVVLVASDGLLTLPEPRIAAIVRRRSRRGGPRIAEALLSAVAAAGEPEQDNTSLVVLHARPRPAARGAAAAAPAGAGFWGTLVRSVVPAGARRAGTGG